MRKQKQEYISLIKNINNMLNITFKEFKDLEPYLSKINFDGLNKINENLINLNESESSIETLDEGLIKSIIGAVGGLWLGPKIGQIICRVLGIEKGLLYNFMTSNITGAALGLAFTKEKNKEK